MKAADELAKEGVEAEIVDLRTLRPLDMDPVIEFLQKNQPCRGCRGGLEILRDRRRNLGPYL